MPIYEYACTSCGERTEAKQTFTDPPLETCPVCGGKLRKLFSPVGIVFKGSGFYSTDSQKKTSSKPAGEKSAASESKSDSAAKPKPEPKTTSTGEQSTKSVKN